MMHDYWIWQKRECEVPWAVYVVKEYENPPTLDNINLHVTIYSEDIENDEHAISFVCWHFDDVKGYVDELEWHISLFAEFFPEDRQQLESAVFGILVGIYQSNQNERN